MSSANGLLEITVFSLGKLLAGSEFLKPCRDGRRENRSADLRLIRRRIARR
jgi:hypothetical protein